MKKPLIIILCFCLYASAKSQSFFYGDQLFSTAGFFQLENNAGRSVYNFNNGWYFYKGDIADAQKTGFNDSAWNKVNLPHGVDILPEGASGGINYQGKVWYRKHFKLPEEMKGKRILVYFEGIMGKCSVYLNGLLIRENKSGYLPIVIDASSLLMQGDMENVIAVMADNSDDPSYPPGKPQYAMDFNYYGGIYRDAFLVATDPVNITDANLADKVAGGGVFVHYENVSKKMATVKVATHIQNGNPQKGAFVLETYLKDFSGKIVASKTNRFSLNANESLTVDQSIDVANPLLWHPEHPYLYNLYTIIKDQKGKIIDGYYQRIGIRSIEFKGREGFFLNGEFFNDKLMGVNRHQDYAYIGNAVPNNLHYRDAKLLRDAGVRIIRLSHYPTDPAFMDACDELGMFTIVATPGWQFWNKDPPFTQFIYSDVRQMIRRDRNHASVIAWEPIPNETYYPEDFARETYKTTHEEYPFAGCFAVCDYGHPAWEIFDILYAHPNEGVDKKTDKSLFTREWGDNVDDWNAQNSPSRVAINWGEVPQLVQAIHYANPPYPYDSWETFYNTGAQYVGGCLWHSFDTQRGYHPDPFYGGIMDAFRQPKFSYELFKSQRDPESPYTKSLKENPYTLYIANIQSPFSPKDVTVFTNCDSVKLVINGQKTLVQKADRNLKMPHPIMVFKDAFDFMEVKAIDRSNKKKITPGIEATGYANGKEVITTKNYPGKRPSAIKLKIDMQGLQPTADGSCVIPVFAYIEDEKGTVKRLNNELVHITVMGEGYLIGDGVPDINPRKMEWGSVPVLIKTTLQPGTIKVIAAPMFGGNQTPSADTIEIRTIAPELKSIYKSSDLGDDQQTHQSKPAAGKNLLTPEEKSKILKKVEKDQQMFETNKNSNK